jgi:DNA-binding beta-propeller fold protein YncE
MAAGDGGSGHGYLPLMRVALVVFGIVFVVVAASAQTAAPASRPAQPLVIEATFPLVQLSGKVGSIAVHPDGARLYIATIDKPAITSINIVERSWLGCVAPGVPAGGLAVSAIGKGLFVAFPEGHWTNDKPGVCRVYDVESFDGRGREPRPDMYKFGVEVHLRDVDHVQADPGSNKTWVGYRDGLAALDGAKPKADATIALDEPPAAFRLEAGGKRRLFANLPKAGMVAVVDASNRVVVDRWKLLDAKGNGPMSLDEAGERLFVVCSKPAKVLAFDTAKGKVVAWADCVADAGDVHFDPGRRRVYITGDGAINVLAFEKDRFKLLGKVAVAPGARTSAWIPSSSRLCVGVPLKGKDSEVWVYRAQP